MSKQLISNDESLVKELYEKLEWYTFEADETEFSAEQVNAIITLLDALDPEGTYDPAKNSKSSRYHIFADGAGTGKASNIEDPLDAAAAFSRFKKKYHLSDSEVSSKVSEDTELDDEREKRLVEELLAIEESGSWDDIFVPIEKVREEEAARAGRKKPARGESVNPNLQAAHRKADAEADTSVSAGDGADGSKFSYSTLVKIAAGVVIATAAFSALNLGTQAIAQKSFFEVLRNGANGMWITVTGNKVEEAGGISGWEAEEDTRTYYDSWEEMEEAVGVKLMKPTYIPEGLQLEKITGEDAISNYFCRVMYGTDEKLFIVYKLYSTNYFKELSHSNDTWVSIKPPEENVNNAEFFKGKDEYSAYFISDNCLIFISYFDYDDLVKIVNSFN